MCILRAYVCVCVLYKKVSLLEIRFQQIACSLSLSLDIFNDVLVICF